MLSSERQEEILRIAKEKNYIEVNSLSRHFNVSKITIYRDIKKLDRENKLKKIHGGAKDNNKLNLEPAFYSRKDKNITQKINAVKNAVSLILDNENIILDSSSTSLYLARELIKLNKSLTIITNNIDIACETVGRNNLQTILIGGVTREITRSTVGPLTLQFLSKINADKFFFSCMGFSKEKGITDVNVDEIEIKKQMQKAATQSICVIDNEKIGKIALYPIFSFNDIDIVVADKETKKVDLKFLKDYDIKVIM